LMIVLLYWLQGMMTAPLLPVVSIVELSKHTIAVPCIKNTPAHILLINYGKSIKGHRSFNGLGYDGRMTLGANSSA